MGRGTLGSDRFCQNTETWTVSAETASLPEAPRFRAMTPQTSERRNEELRGLLATSPRRLVPRGAQCHRALHRRGRDPAPRPPAAASRNRGLSGGVSSGRGPGVLGPCPHSGSPFGGLAPARRACAHGHVGPRSASCCSSPSCRLVCPGTFASWPDAPHVHSGESKSTGTSWPQHVCPRSPEPSERVTGARARGERPCGGTFQRGARTAGRGRG